MGNDTFPSNPFTGPFNYAISTDGTVTYAYNGSHLVYGGPNDAGGVNGENAAVVVNAAMAALNGTGGRIGVYSGNYVIIGKVNFVSNVELSCDGAAFTLEYDSCMFEFAGISGASLLGAVIVGGKGNLGVAPIIVKDYLGVGSTGNTIAYNHILGSGNRGISIEGPLSSYNNVSCNIISDVAKEGLMISHSNYNTVYGNIVNHTGCHGIASTGGSYNNITANTINGAGANYISGFAHGIAVDGNEGTNQCIGNTITNNTIKTAYMAGIEVADGAHSTTITNNSVIETGACGIFFGGAYAISYNGSISGNIVSNCGLGGDQGIFVSGMSANNRTWKVSVTDNHVESAGVDGIRLKWVTDSNVTGNICHSCGGYGLAFEDSNIDCIVIEANDVSGNALGGLNLNGVNIPYSAVIKSMLLCLRRA